MTRGHGTKKIPVFNAGDVVALLIETLETQAADWPPATYRKVMELLENEFTWKGSLLYLIGKQKGETGEDPTADMDDLRLSMLKTEHRAGTAKSRPIPFPVSSWVETFQRGNPKVRAWLFHPENRPPTDAWQDHVCAPNDLAAALSHGKTRFTFWAWMVHSNVHVQEALQAGANPNATFKALSTANSPLGEDIPLVAFVEDSSVFKQLHEAGANPLSRAANPEKMASFLAELWAPRIAQLHDAETYLGNHFSALPEEVRSRIMTPLVSRLGMEWISRPILPGHFPGARAFYQRIWPKAPTALVVTEKHQTWNLNAWASYKDLTDPLAPKVARFIDQPWDTQSVPGINDRVWALLIKIKPGKTVSLTDGVLGEFLQSPPHEVAQQVELAMDFLDAHGHGEAAMRLANSLLGKRWITIDALGGEDLKASSKQLTRVVHERLAKQLMERLQGWWQTAPVVAQGSICSYLIKDTQDASLNQRATLAVMALAGNLECDRAGLVRLVEKAMNQGWQGPSRREFPHFETAIDTLSARALPTGFRERLKEIRLTMVLPTGDAPTRPRSGLASPRGRRL